MENEDASLDEMHSKLNLYPFLIPRKKKREKNSFIFFLRMWFSIVKWYVEVAGKEC